MIRLGGHLASSLLGYVSIITFTQVPSNTLTLLPRLAGPRLTARLPSYRQFDFFRSPHRINPPRHWRMPTSDRSRLSVLDE